MLIQAIRDRRLMVMLCLLCVCIVVLTLERITVSSRTTATPTPPSVGGESAETSSLHLANASAPQVVNISVTSDGTDAQQTIVKECTHVPYEITSGLLEWKPAPDK